MPLNLIKCSLFRKYCNFLIMYNKAQEKTWTCVLRNTSEYTLAAHEDKFTQQSGTLEHSLPFRIEPGDTVEIGWAKFRFLSPTDAHDVVHFNIGDTMKVLNIMGSVPYSWNVSKVWANICFHKKGSHLDIYSTAKAVVASAGVGKLCNDVGHKLSLTRSDDAVFMLLSGIIMEMKK